MSPAKFLQNCFWSYSLIADETGWGELLDVNTGFHDGSSCHHRDGATLYQVLGQKRTRDHINYDDEDECLKLLEGCRESKSISNGV